MRLTLIALIGAIAFAQSPTETRTLTFTMIEDQRDMQEFVNLLRAVASIHDVALDRAARTVTVTGTADQLSLAGWMLTELDTPAGSHAGGFAVRDAAFEDARNPVVKLCYAVHLAKLQQLQEAINGIRSITETQFVVAMTRHNAVFRATADRAAFAEWLLREADAAAAGTAPRAASQYVFPDPIQYVERRTPQARVYHPAGQWTPADLQEVVNALRSITDLQRVVSFSAGSAIALRGSQDQVAMADWLMSQISQAVATGSHEYQAAPLRGEVARVFFPANGKTTEALAGDIAQVKQEAGILRVVGCARSGAVIVRGTADQINVAAGVLQ